jgi:hypothetical protein
MANTLNGSNVAEILRAGFEAFKSALVPINAFSTDFSLDARRPNESITTRIYRTIAAKAFESNYKATPDNTTDAVTVTLNQNKFTNFHLTDTEAGKSPVDQLTNFAREAGYGLAKDALDYALSLVTATNYGNTAADKITVSAAAFDVDDVVDAMKLGLDKGWSQGSLILSYGHAAALLKDGAIKDASAYGTSGPDAPIQSGRIGTLFGFPVYAYAVPNNSESLAGMLVNPAALAFAMRPMTTLAAVDGTSTSVELMTDADSNITIAGRMFYEDSEGIMYGAYHGLYGASKANDKGLIRIVSA